MSEEKLIEYLNNQIDEVTKQINDQVDSRTPMLNDSDSVAIHKILADKKSAYEGILNFVETERKPNNQQLNNQEVLYKVKNNNNISI